MLSSATAGLSTFDERGNTAQRLDATGTVLSSHSTEAFGLTQSTITGTSSDPFDGFGAQWGDYTDHETGLILCTNRYYDPNTARWLTRDPIGYGGGINLYSYCSNNPVMGIDPLGFCGCADDFHDSGMSGDMWDAVASGFQTGLDGAVSGFTGGELGGCLSGDPDWVFRSGLKNA